MREDERTVLVPDIRPARMQKIDGIVSRHLNRRASVPLAHALEAISWVTPNLVSWTALFLACLAAVFYAAGNMFLPQDYTVLGVPPSLIVGGMLVQLSSIVDGVDGDLARLRGTASVGGGILDAVLDRYADLAIVTGMYLAVLGERPLVAVLPLSLLLVPVGAEMLLIVYALAVAGSLLVSYSRAKMEQGGVFERRDGRFLGMTRDVRLFVIFVCSVLGCPFLALLAIAISGNLTVATRLRTLQ